MCLPFPTPLNPDDIQTCQVQLRWSLLTATPRIICTETVKATGFDEITRSVEKDVRGL